MSKLALRVVDYSRTLRHKLLPGVGASLESLTFLTLSDNTSSDCDSHYNDLSVGITSTVCVSHQRLSETNFLRTVVS